MIVCCVDIQRIPYGRIAQKKMCAHVLNQKSNSNKWCKFMWYVFNVHKTPSLVSRHVHQRGGLRLCLLWIVYIFGIWVFILTSVVCTEQTPMWNSEIVIHKMSWFGWFHLLCGFVWWKTCQFLMIVIECIL